MKELDPACRPLVDTHAHLDDKRLLSELPAVLKRARAAGVAQIVAVGIDAASSQSVVKLASVYNGVYASVGVHPNEVAQKGLEDWPRIVELVGAPRVVAIGETGLDRHWDDTPFDQQLDFFHKHLDLAHEHGLPVVIHSRDCQAELIQTLQGLRRPVRGVSHSFAGTQEEAEALLELGLFLSFSGMVTYANKTLDPLREVASRVPADRLLVETDCPYLSPHPFRGKTNEPARVGYTAQRVAEIRGISVSELARVTSENARVLFDLERDDWLTNGG